MQQRMPLREQLRDVGNISSSGRVGADKLRLPLREFNSNTTAPVAGKSGSFASQKPRSISRSGNVTLRNRQRLEAPPNGTSLQLGHFGSFQPVTLRSKGLQARPQMSPVMSPAVTPRICQDLSPRELESAPVLRTTPRPCDFQTGPKPRRSQSQTALASPLKEPKSARSCKEVPNCAKENDPLRTEPAFVQAQVVEDKGNKITMMSLHEQICELRGEVARMQSYAGPPVKDTARSENGHNSICEQRNSVSSVNEMIDRTTRRTADLLRLGSTPPSSGEEQRSGTSTDIPRGTPRKRQGQWQAGSSSSPEPITTDSSVTPEGSSIQASAGPSPVLENLQHTVFSMRNQAAEKYREVDHLKDQVLYQHSVIEEQRAHIEKQHAELTKLRSQSAAASRLSCIDRKKNEEDEAFKEDYGLFGCFRRITENKPTTSSPAKSPQISRSRSVGYLQNGPEPVSLSSALQAADDTKAKDTAAPEMNMRNKVASPGSEIRVADRSIDSQVTLSPNAIRRAKREFGDSPNALRRARREFSPNVTLSPARQSISPAKRSHSSPPVPSPPCPRPPLIQMQKVAPQAATAAQLTCFPSAQQNAQPHPALPETYSIATPMASPRSINAPPGVVWYTGPHAASTFPEYPHSARIATPRITPLLMQPQQQPLPGASGCQRVCNIPASPEAPIHKAMTRP
eukprot:gnl/MRDRNA2_/MRDRNA2_102690_c0_seq1.p1 gnl/MRDRNA2_/MRDRNA2_102690_c0~~gnl/MRDRNA2_/MRDRNA2_102690_c0_seq1.p1  ORF type:complete len:683 (-),score=102.19 gnl/MRDRNA2_/MRDRNA2_102690_c0_seq1:52-2100(-)